MTRAAAALLLGARTTIAAPAGPGPDPDHVVGVVTPPSPAEPASTTASQPAPVGGDLTAADVAADPLPGYESGRLDEPEDDSTGRKIGRGALFVPKLVFDAVLTPLRGAVWAEEHYHLLGWYDRIFYNDDKTIGLYPTGSIDTSLGVTAGAHFVDSNLFGEHEALNLQAEIGTHNRQVYSISLASGKRLGDRLALALDLGYERRPHDGFYGIGNGDRNDVVPAMPIDPRVDATAAESYYSQHRARATVTGDVRLWRALHLRPGAALADVTFGEPNYDEPIAMVYDPRGLVGFDGIRYSYTELELRWDDRRGVTVMEPPSVHSAGSLAGVYAGLEHRLDNGPDFWRYGADLEHFIRLTEGPRVLALHLHGEGVTGSRDDVPFTELPRLGGPLYLRGYALDQFRDRVAAFGSVAYQWDLSQWFSAEIFTDVGRVYPALGDLSLDHLRVGYGVGLEGHSIESFAFEASLGSSIDGGLFLNLAFNPVYDIDQRVRRR